MFKSIVVLAGLPLAACASATAVPVIPDNPHPAGLRVSSVKPVLVVTGTSAKTEYIPNPSNGYAIQSIASKIGCTRKTLRGRTAGVGYGRPSAMPEIAHG